MLFKIIILFCLSISMCLHLSAGEKPGATEQCVVGKTCGDDETSRINRTGRLDLEMNELDARVEEIYNKYGVDETLQIGTLTIQQQKELPSSVIEELKKIGIRKLKIYKSKAKSKAKAKCEITKGAATVDCDGDVYVLKDGVNIGGKAESLSDDVFAIARKARKPNANRSVGEQESPDYYPGDGYDSINR